jgi:hypothetical protein
MADSVKAGSIKDRLKKASDSVRNSFGMLNDDEEEKKRKKKEEEEAEEEKSTTASSKTPKGFIDLSKSFRDSWK